MTAFLRALKAREDGLAAVEFAIIAPVLLMLVFGIIVYSMYFAAFLGVRQAAAEGARVAMAGLSPAERTQLASQRANAVMAAYQPLMGSTTVANVTTSQPSPGLFEVDVSYDITSSPFVAYGSLLPLPSSVIRSSAIVANGSY